MTNALTVTTSRANEIYAKIDNPMAAIVEMGKLFHQSQIMGVSTQGDGAVLALTCMCEGITPLEFARTYHIIKGKPSMRADAMAAKFQQAGGKILWKNIGDDGLEARAVFEFEGQSLEMVYTIEDAKKAKGKDGNTKNEMIDKPDGNWMKDRGSMLRARLITKAVRILAPGIIAGVYIADEIEDLGDNADPAKASADARKKRVKELDEAAATATVITDPQETGSKSDVTTGTIKSEDVIINVVAEPKTDKVAESPTFETGDIATAEQLRTLAGSGTAAGYTILEINQAAIALYGVESVKKITTAQAAELSARYKLLTEAISLGQKYPSAADKSKNMERAETLQLLCTKCEVDQAWKVPDARITNLINAIRKHLGAT